MPLEVTLVSADRQVWSGEAGRSWWPAPSTVTWGSFPVMRRCWRCWPRVRSRSSRPTGSAVVATVDGGFLSVEHDRVTMVSDQAAIASGSTTRCRGGAAMGNLFLPVAVLADALHRARRPLGRGAAGRLVLARGRGHVRLFAAPAEPARPRRLGPRRRPLRGRPAGLVPGVRRSACAPPGPWPASGWSSSTAASPTRSRRTRLPAWVVVRCAYGPTTSSSR